ncbi:integrase [Chloroflexota bacterium]
MHAFLGLGIKCYEEKHDQKINELQERLGHSSIQITLDTYSHVVPGLQQAAAIRFDDIVLPDKKTVKENLD